jgi:uncharacterized protein YbjQ (UPF0145 family)
MWTCAGCGETVEENLTSCWNCLAPRPVPAGLFEPPEPRNHAFPAVDGAEEIPDITITTTATLETHAIRRYLGVVAGEALLSSSSVKRLAEGLARDVASDRHGRRERLKAVRRSALIDAALQAVDMGANAIVSLRFDYELIGSTLLVSCQGTAVMMEKLVEVDF